MQSAGRPLPVLALMAKALPSQAQPYEHRT